VSDVPKTKPGPHRWQKGQSGNPAGKPVSGWRAACRDFVAANRDEIYARAMAEQSPQLLIEIIRQGHGVKPVKKPEGNGDNLQLAVQFLQLLQARLDPATWDQVMTASKQLMPQTLTLPPPPPDEPGDE